MAIAVGLAGRGPGAEPGGAPAPVPLIALNAVVGHIPPAARALVLVDARLCRLIAADLSADTPGAAARRKFEIAVLPIVGLDDCRPPDVRRAIARRLACGAAGLRRTT